MWDYSPNYGPLVDIDYITAPNTKGHQSGTLTLGTTHVAEYLNVWGTYGHAASVVSTRSPKISSAEPSVREVEGFVVCRSTVHGYVKPSGQYEILSILGLLRDP